MNRQTAMGLLDAIRRGEISAEEAPADLWSWLASHVSFVPTPAGLQARIED